MNQRFPHGNQAPLGAVIACAGEAENRPLGIVTGNSAPPPVSRSATAGTVYTFEHVVSPDSVDLSTGEVLEKTPQRARAERWALKSVVNRLLSGDRVSKCMVLRAPVPGQGLAPIEVHKGQTHGKAFYHGLMACGLPWVCPVCAAKIAERRRVELKQAMDAAKAKGWGVHFVTLTVPHGVGDDLHDLLDRLSVALRKMSSNATFRKAKAQVGLEVYGYIRAQEVTYGQNGWHPHFHLVVFTQGNMGSSVVQYAYSKSWRSACVASGLPEPHPVHGCTAQDGSYADKYVSKWGIEDEMTKAHTKKAKRHGLTPWGLLRAVLDGNSPEIAPEPAAKLFQLYAKAFKGRRQLHWSVGLRAKLLPDQVDMTDQEIVERPEDERAILLAGLSTAQWAAIRKAHAQATVLEAAEAGADRLAFVIDAITKDRGRAGCDAGAPVRTLDGVQADSVTPIELSLSIAKSVHADPLLPIEPLDFRLADIGRLRL